MIEDFDRCYRVLQSRDSRFDGVFVTAVTSTGIYCRPSCPAITPKRSNIRFFASAAGAQVAGFRACKRCRPDASPGSPEWNVRADVVARAMRLIADGIVDREGVAGLAGRLHFSERQIHRQLVAEVGAGPQALARAHRAQTARILIETTPLVFSEIAFASGFASIRQFNDTIREVFVSTPTQLRAQRRTAEPSPGSIVLRLPYRAPFFGRGLFSFLGTRSVRGIEEFDGQTYRRTMRLSRSSAVVELAEGEGHVNCVLRLDDVRDLTEAVQKCRRLLDLDADPVAVDEVLSRDVLLRDLVAQAPGRRVPGSVDAAEMAVRAVVGQQISVAATRTLMARIVEQYGKPLTSNDGKLTHLFPEPEVLADADFANIGIPQSKRSTISRLASSLAEGDIVLDSGADRIEAQVMLQSMPGIGPWTSSYIAMRALGDPDAFLPTDLGLKRAIERLRAKGTLEDIAEQWRPWRAYALQHLWGSLDNKKRGVR